MSLKNMLRDVQANGANVLHGCLPQVVFNTSTLAHRGRRRRPPHQNRRAGWRLRASVNELAMAPCSKIRSDDNSSSMLLYWITNRSYPTRARRRDGASMARH